MRRFFVGTYSQGEGDLFTLHLDTEKARLSVASVWTGSESPSFLAVEGNHLYAVSERLDGGALCSFIILPDGSLVKLSCVDAPYPGLCHLSVWPDRTALSAASYFGGGAVTCALSPDGALAPNTQWLPNSGHSIHPERQEQAHVHSLTPDPSGRFIVEADLGTDRLLVYRMEHAKLVPHATFPVPAGEGPRHFVFHPSGRYAYLITELGNHIILFDYDAATGTLAQRQTCALLRGGETAECSAADIHITADGRFLFASVRGVPHLVRFEVTEDGSLGVRAFLPCGVNAVRNFCIDASNRFLLVADQHASTVSLFGLNPLDGLLSDCLDSIRIPCPVCVINA